MKKVSKKGFTLIELMVVIAILVIIMGLALPSIVSVIERMNQRETEEKRGIIEGDAETYFSGKTEEEKLKGIKVSKLIEKAQIPKIKSKDVCDEDDCCVKYEKNAESNVYEFVVKPSDNTSCN